MSPSTEQIMKRTAKGRKEFERQEKEIEEDHKREDAKNKKRYEDALVRRAARLKREAEEAGRIKTPYEIIDPYSSMNMIGLVEKSKNRPRTEHELRVQKTEDKKKKISEFVEKRQTKEKGKLMDALKEKVKSSKEEKAEAKRLLKEEKEKEKAEPVKAVKYSVAKFKELEKKIKFSMLAIQKKINQGEDGKELTKAKEEHNELIAKYKEMKEHTDKIKTKPFSAVLIKTITKIEGHIHGDHIVDSKISSDMAVSEKAKYKKHIDDAVNELKELLETKYPSEESESSSSESESDEDEKPKKKKPKKKTDDDEPAKPRGRPKKVSPNSKPEGYIPSGKARNEAKAAALKEQEDMERAQAGKAPLQKRGRKPKDFIPEPVVEKKGRAPKGSQEAKDKMAAIRAKRLTKNANVIR